MTLTTVSMRLKLTNYDIWKILKIALVLAHVWWKHENS